jgi:succinyl-CoA synthetase alpha subunit
MAKGSLVRKNQYYDSVFLMGVNKRLSQVPGVRQTAVLMGTGNNKRLLADIGITGEAIDAAGPGDLIVAVIADSEQVVELAINHLDKALLATTDGKPRSTLHRLEDALHLQPAANLAVFTIPGDYVGREARKALEAGLNVFIFSSNVSPAEELELKQTALTKGLLVMGPDCGTSIVGGVGIGFANAVRRGRIGAVGPSGTGLQEFTTQIHHAGAGISHALGTGSRDLSDSIGGLTTFAALESLERDPHTDVVAVIAKPPGRKTLRQLKERLSSYSKPTVACFLGMPVAEVATQEGRSTVRTIDDAAQSAVELLNGLAPRPRTALSSEERRRAAEDRQAWSARQKYVRGVFAGGTFCYQTQQLLQDRGLDVRSNAPLKPELGLADPNTSVGNTLVDMGDETYTQGRPHPMIDAALRRQRILVEGQDPEVGVLLLDFILGYNASQDPVGDLMDPILEAQRSLRAAGGQLSVVASICGTEADPQDLGMQRSLLENAGVVVFESSARAALFCAELLKPE